MSISHRAVSSMGLVLGLTLIPTATATPAPPRSHQQGTQNGTHVGAAHKNQQHGNQQHGAAVAIASQLKAAHTLLVQADHDYQGHRAKAAHEVTSAIHELMGSNHNGGAGGQAGVKNQQGAGQAGAKNQQVAGQAGANNQQAGGGNPKMPQAQSDANLQKATQMLSATLAKMPAGHKSTAHVHAAINEIGTALKIK